MGNQERRFTRMHRSLQLLFVNFRLFLILNFAYKKFSAAPKCKPPAELKNGLTFCRKGFGNGAKCRVRCKKNYRLYGGPRNSFSQFNDSKQASVGRPKIARPRPVLVPEFLRTTRPRPVLVPKFEDHSSPSRPRPKISSAFLRPNSASWFLALKALLFKMHF